VAFAPGSLLAICALIAGRIGPVMTDLDLYPVTAAAVVLGVLMLAFSQSRMRRMAAWIPLTFALSVIVGSIGMFVAERARFSSCRASCLAAPLPPWQSAPSD
jgi:hypothetical protein